MRITEEYVQLTLASLRTFAENASRFGAADDAVVRVSHKRKGGSMTTLTLDTAGGEPAVEAPGEAPPA